MIFAIAACLDRPSSGPELTRVPSPGVAAPGHRRVRRPGVEHHPHRQPELPGEVQVALVMSGDRHDRAGAVIRQHVVGRPDRDRLAVDRVDGVAAQEHAGLVPLGRLTLDIGQLPHVSLVSLQRRPVLGRAQLSRQRRVGRDDEERGPVQRVRPGGEDRDGLLATLDLEADVRALAAADPVALHQQDALGPPALQRRHVLQQPVRVLGDLEVPLGQHPADDLGPAPLALAVDHLLIGQHRLVDRAPVDVAVGAVGQAALVEPQEQPLRPAVVLRVAGLQPARPVEGDRVLAERRCLHLDVLVGPVGRMGVVPDRGVLGGQAECVPADRVQHVMTAQGVVPRHRVTQRVRLRMTHMQVTRRVGEHVQDIRARPRIGGVIAGAESVHRGPALLPLVLNRARIVAIRGFGGCHDFLANMVRSGSAPARPGFGDFCCSPVKTTAPRVTRGSRAGDRQSARLAKEQAGETHAHRVAHSAAGPDDCA